MVNRVFIGVGGFFVLMVFIFALIFGGFRMMGFAIFEQSSQLDFDEGTHSNTEWNGSAIVLSSEQTSGTYTSKVFDAGAEASWNNISWQGEMPSVDLLFCVDGGGDIYKSSDGGISWVMTQEDFGRTVDNVKDMFSNTGYLYILSSAGNEVWCSANGTGFSVIYNDFDGKSPYVEDRDSNGDLYVATGPGGVWKSSDNGTTWTLQGDFNGGATNDPKGIAIDSNGYIFAVGSAGNVFKSNDSGVTWVKTIDGYGGSTGTDGMEADGNDNLYILLNTKIYKSNDSGVTWVVINDSISQYANTLVEIFVNDNDEFFILDAVGRVFKSTDYGITWVEIGDCNLGSTNDPKGLTDFIQSTSLILSVKSCDDSECSGEDWGEVSNPLDLGLDDNRYFQYKFDFLTDNSDISPSLESVNVNYDLLNTAPIITLIEPSEGTTYGYNESIALEFFIEDDEEDKEFCWYNVNGGENVFISNCQNTTFSVPGNGDYVLTIYVNDSLGEQSQDSANFSVSLGAPTIILHSPLDKDYINYNEINFVYTPSDIDLDSCELWGDFTGTFTLNQTDTSQENESQNIFNLNLSDGSYKWNIWCNDTEGNFAFNGNRTLYVDTTPPSITISEPKGRKTSRTGIPLTFSVSDASPTNCFYNVYRGGNVEISNTSISCSENEFFNVTVDADFVLNFYVNDEAGNFNYTLSSFSIDTSTSSPKTPGGGSSGGVVISMPMSLSKLNVEKMSVILLPGEEKSLQVNVKNEGRTSANRCKLTADKNYLKYFESRDIKNIGVGELVEFNFILKAVDKNIGNLNLFIECLDNVSSKVPLSITILESKLDISIKEILIEKEELLVKYSIKTNIDSTEDIYFRILNSIGGSLDEVLEKVYLKSNETYEGEVKISLSGAENGMLKLLVIGDNKEVVLVEEDFIYSGRTLFTGYVLLNYIKNFSYITIILIVFLIIVFLLGKRIKKLKKLIN